MAEEMFKTTLMGGFDKDDVQTKVQIMKDEAFAEKSKLIKEGKEKDILTYGILDVAKNKYLYYTAGIDVAKRLERDWNFYDDNNPDNADKQLVCTSHPKEE